MRELDVCCAMSWGRREAGETVASAVKALVTMRVPAQGVVGCLDTRDTPNSNCSDCRIKAACSPKTTPPHTSNGEQMGFKNNLLVVQQPELFAKCNRAQSTAV